MHGITKRKETEEIRRKSKNLEEKEEKEKPQKAKCVHISQKNGENQPIISGIFQISESTKFLRWK